jgi:DNA-binding transcriptional LysR family regulator
MRIPRITIDMLVAVVAVARKATLEEAAKEIGLLTASAVYKRVQAANNLFGAPLFSNTENGMVLTEAGKMFHSDALCTLEQALLTEDRVAAFLYLETGRLLVGHSTYLPPKLLAAVRKFDLADSAHILVEHVSGFTEDIAQRVTEGTLHAGFGYLPVHHPELISRLLYEEPLVVCMPAGHPFSSKTSIRPPDLTDEPVVALGRASLPWLHQEIEDYFGGFGVSLRVVADAFGPPEAVTMVEQRVGVCVLGASAVSRPGVITKPLEPKILTRRSGLFFREDNRHPTLAAFIERAMETMAGKPHRR